MREAPERILLLFFIVARSVYFEEITLYACCHNNDQFPKGHFLLTPLNK